jgi:pimeloyl-ACP methyl ester carboxylesterase
VQDKFVVVEGLRLHYVMEGHGPAMVLVHGSHKSNTWRTWEHNIRGLAAYHRVFVPELPGYGQSPRPLGRGLSAGLTYDLGASILIGLMSALGLPSSTLVGASYGGGICLKVAVTRPELLDKLILVDTVTPEVDPDLGVDLGSIRCPTLIVWGEDDALIPISAGYSLQRAIAGSELCVIPDSIRASGGISWAGHAPYRFQPDAFNLAVIQFTRERRPKARATPERRGSQ